MIAAAVRHLEPGQGRRPYSDDERAVVEDILAAAVEWQAGNLPLGEFWRLGTLRPRRWTHQAGGAGGTVTTCRGADEAGYSRFCALVWATNAGDPRRAALLAAIEEANRRGWLRPRTDG